MLVPLALASVSPNTPGPKDSAAVPRSSAKMTGASSRTAGCDACDGDRAGRVVETVVAAVVSRLPCRSDGPFLRPA
jgi:hypothetical protein